MRFARSRMQISAMLQRSESKEEQHGPVEQRNALESAALGAQRRKHWKKRPAKGDDVRQSLRGVAAARCAGAKARRTKHKNDGR